MDAAKKNLTSSRKRALNCLWLDVEQQQHPLMRQRRSDPVLETPQQPSAIFLGWSVGEIGEASQSESSYSPRGGYGTSIFSRDPDLSGDRATPRRSPTHRAHNVTSLPLDMDGLVLEGEDLALINELFELSPSSSPSSHEHQKPK